VGNGVSVLDDFVNPVQMSLALCRSALNTENLKYHLKLRVAKMGSSRRENRIWHTRSSARKDLLEEPQTAVPSILRRAIAE
jgi:hypothetical protein